MSDMFGIEYLFRPFRACEVSISYEGLRPSLTYFALSELWGQTSNAI